MYVRRSILYSYASFFPLCFSSLFIIKYKASAVRSRISSERLCKLRGILLDRAYYGLLMMDNATKVILDGFETKHVTG